MNKPALNLLLVDDEDSVRIPLARHLRAEPYEYVVRDVASVEEALQALEEAKGRFDVALIDEVLGEGEGPNGLDLLRKIKAQHAQIECILFTGWGMQSGLEALQTGAYRYFAKPFNLEELALTIRFAADQKVLQREREYLSALVQVSRELTLTTEIEVQLTLVWHYLKERLAASTLFIALYDLETDTLRFHQSYDEGEEDPLPDRQLGSDPSGWGVAGYVVKTGREQIWFDREEALQEWQGMGIKPYISGKGPSESGICLPLRVGEKILGALSVQSYRAYGFDLVLLNTVRALANQLAVAVENSRLVIETKQKALNLDKLQNLTLAINSTLDLTDVLTQSCQAVVELLGVDHSGLVVFDPDLTKGKVFAEYPPTERTIGQTIPVQGISAEEQLVFRREVVYIPDLENDISLGTVRDILLSLGIRSTLIVPIVFNRRVVASFSLDAMQELRVFSQEEVDICQRLANQVAVAIENAGLIAREQGATRRMRKQADGLRVLYEIGKEITAARNVDFIWDSIAKHLIRLVGARRSLFLLVDTKAKRLIKATGYGYPPEHLQRMSIAEVEAGVSGWVLRNKKALLIENAQNDPRNTGMALAKARDFDTAPLIVAPLLIKDEAIGTLTVANAVGDPPFDEEDKELVIMLAAKAAIAYDNARRMRELEQLQKAAQALAGVLEPAQVLQQIVESACDILQADSSAVWSFDNVRNRTIPEELVAHGIPRDQLERFRKQAPTQGGTAETVMKRRWVGVTDISDPQYSFIGPSTMELLNQIGARSFGGIALRAGEENLGVLYINYNCPRDFTPEDRRVLETFANQAALALKKARLSRQVNRARDAAAVIAQIVALGKNNPEDWDANVERIKDALPCDAVTLYRYNEDSGELVYPPAMAGVQYREEATRLPSVPEDSIVWNVLRSDDLLIVKDAVSDPATRNRRFTKEEGIKSLIAMPLKAGDRKVGVMFVNYQNNHRFTQDELTHIGLFANQIAVAIGNEQLHERLQRQAERLEGLYRAGKAVTGLLTLNEILQRIAEQAWHLVGRRASYTVIRLVENDVARVVATYPPEELDHRRATIPGIDLRVGVNGRIGVTGRAIRTGIPQLVNDVDSDSDYISSRPQIHSELAVPIRAGERVIGAINVDSRQIRAFNDDDQQTLMSLASYAAIAINNAQLHERTKGQAQTLGALYEAGKAISHTLALDEVLTHVAEQALDIVHANVHNGCFSHVALLDGGKLHFVASFPPQLLGDLQQCIGEIDLQNDGQKGIAGQAALTKQPQTIPEVSSNPDYIPLRESINIHSQLSVPLRIGEQVIGVLSIEHPLQNAFGQEDVQNVELLAAQAAVAIQNARRYEELQKTYQDVQKTKATLVGRTALAWTGMISSTWGHAVEKHAVTIREQIQLLRQDASTLPKIELLENRLEMIERLANQILEKPITPPLSAEEGVGSVPINDLIRERTRQLWANEPHQSAALKLDVRLENLATVRASPEWLRRALDILIDNAVEAAAGLPRRKIVIGSQQSDHHAEISITDNGRGIPQEVLERLFIEPIKKPQGTKGQGIGLLLVQLIVQTYGGKVYCRQTGPKGTTMVISLPLETS